jgi:hypothetical protein
MDHGAVVVFVLMTKAARDWVDRSVDIPSYLRMGSFQFACEHRYAPDIITGMQEAGLAVA